MGFNYFFGYLDQIHAHNHYPDFLYRTQPQYGYRYWDFHERGISQAVLLEGHWKGLRLKEVTAPIQLCDLAKDLGEESDISAQHPKMVARIAEIMLTAHVDNDRWKIPGP